MRCLSKRNLPVLLLAVSAFMLALYTLFWYSQMRKFKAEIARMYTGDGQMFDVQAKQIEFSGFPYRLAASFDTAQLVRQRSDYIVTMDARRLDITRLLWAPGHLLLIADQPKVILRSRGGSRPLKFSFNADTLESSLRVSPRKVERLSFEFRNVLWNEGHMLHLPINIADLQFHLRDSVAPSGAVTRKTKLPVFANLRIMAGAIRSGNSPPVNADVFVDLTGGKHLEDRSPLLDLWRQRGGSLEIRSFVIVRPGLTWSATGGMALDASGGIAGTGILHSNAPEATISLLQEKPIPAAKSDFAGDVNWQIEGGILQFDGVPVVKVPFQLIDLVGD
jgi:hypothetical protein